MLRIFTITLPVLLLAGVGLSGNTKYEITPQSKMWIEGTSTVHNWTCSTTQVVGSIEMDESTGSLTRAVVTVPSAAVDCDNGTMNKKAASALQTGKYPVIRFTLTSAKSVKTEAGRYFDATGTMELAGKTKDVTIGVDAVMQSGGVYRFDGTFPLVMSDYGIDAPTAMLGTLKTGDRVQIRFEVFAAPSGMPQVVGTN